MHDCLKNVTFKHFCSLASCSHGCHFNVKEVFMGFLSLKNCSCCNTVMAISEECAKDNKTIVSILRHVPLLPPIC